MARNQISQYTPTESSGGNNEMMDNQNKNTYFKNFQDLVDLLYLNNGTFHVSVPVAEYFITYGEVPDYNTMSKLLGKDSLSTNRYNDIVKIDVKRSRVKIKFLRLKDYNFWYNVSEKFLNIIYLLQNNIFKYIIAPNFAFIK